MLYSNGMIRIYTRDKIYSAKDYLQEPVFFSSFDENGKEKTQAYYSISKDGKTIFQTSDVIREEDFAQKFLGVSSTELTDEIFQQRYDRLLKRLTDEKILFDILLEDPDNDIGESEDLIYELLKVSAVFAVYLKERGMEKAYYKMFLCFKSEEIQFILKNIAWMPEDLWRKGIKDFLLKTEYMQLRDMFMDLYRASIGAL